MARISRLVRAVVLCVVLVMATFTAVPAQASGQYWFSHPGMTCGPSQHVYIATVSSGPGRIYVQWATADSLGAFAVGAEEFRTGYHITDVTNRYLNSYDVGARSGAHLLSYGIGCMGI